MLSNSGLGQVGDGLGIFGHAENFLAQYCLGLARRAEDAAAIRLAASIKLYELGRLSSGAAARLAGVVFPSKLDDYGVDTFRLTAEELERQAPLA